MHRRTTPRFWMFMIVSMLIVFGACFGVLFNQYMDGNRRLAEAEAYRDQRISQVEALSEEMEYVQTDEYVIRAARDALGLVMPGEVRYVSSAG